MPVMLDALDEDGNVIVWNRECERVTGYSADEIVNNPDAMLRLYPDEAKRAEMLRAWAQRGDDFRSWEWDLTCKDGTVRTIAWSNISERISIPGWTSWSRWRGRNRTSERRAGAAVRAKQRYAQLSGRRRRVSSSSGTGKIVWCNERALELIRRAREDVIGKDTRMPLR